MAMLQPSLGLVDPTIQEIESWDEILLLEWIQRKLKVPLKHDDVEKFLNARVDGEAFLQYAGQRKFFLDIGIHFVPSDKLAHLAQTVVDVESLASRDKSLKVDVKDAFKDGIKYKPPGPRSLLSTSGIDWKFQPHPDLYKTLAQNVLSHYKAYKDDRADKSLVGTFFYLGGAGTGKSRHGTEFASSIQEAITAFSYQDPLYHELTQRLEKAFVFHVSFENGSSLVPKEYNELWKALGIRMLHQVVCEPLEDMREKYVAKPSTIFELIAVAEKADLYRDFTGILVVDGVSQARISPDDGWDRDSRFYHLLSQIANLSLRPSMSPEVKGQRTAPFIITCVAATCFGPIDEFLASSHSKRIYLPLNQIDAPVWKKDNTPVIKPSPFTSLLVKDVGGHARAMELMAGLLDEYRNGPEPNMSEFADKLRMAIENYYDEALNLLGNHTFSIAQCILSGRTIQLRDKIPGSNTAWESVTTSGLIWFERTRGTIGRLVAPYILLWMISRLQITSADRNYYKDTALLQQFLSDWKFNDYGELFYLMTGRGSAKDITWQSFERFCCSFRILRSLGFRDGEEVLLEHLHMGCKLRDDRMTRVVNRHLKFDVALYQYRTNSIEGENPASGKARSAKEINTQHSRTLNADAQLSHIILNGASAQAGDFFLSIKTAIQSKIVREAGQCKLIRKKLTMDVYENEKKKAAGPDDIFILYTPTSTSGDFTESSLPDRSGIVESSCWESYFGPFSGRAYLASQSSLKD